MEKESGRVREESGQPHPAHVKLVQAQQNSIENSTIDLQFDCLLGGESVLGVFRLNQQTDLPSSVGAAVYHTHLP